MMVIFNTEPRVRFSGSFSFFGFLHIKMHIDLSVCVDAKDPNHKKQMSHRHLLVAAIIPFITKCQLFDCKMGFPHVW